MVLQRSKTAFLLLLLVDPSAAWAGSQFAQVSEREELFHPTGLSEPLPSEQAIAEDSLSLRELYEFELQKEWFEVDVESLKSLLSEAESAGQLRLEFEVRLTLGHYAFYVEGIPRALEYWEPICQHEPAEELAPLVSAAHNDIGGAHVADGRLVEGMEHFKLALKFAQGAQAAEALINLGDVEVKLGQLREASHSYASALARPGARARIGGLLGLSDVCLELGELEAARLMLARTRLLLDDQASGDLARLGPSVRLQLEQLTCDLLIAIGAHRAAQEAMEGIWQNYPWDSLTWTAQRSLTTSSGELCFAIGQPEHALILLELHIGRELDEGLADYSKFESPNARFALIRARCLAAVDRWGHAARVLKSAAYEDLSIQSKLYEDFWRMTLEAASRAGRQNLELLAHRRIQGLREGGADESRQALRREFSAAGLKGLLGHLVASDLDAGNSGGVQPAVSVAPGIGPSEPFTGTVQPGVMPASAVSRPAWAWGLAAVCSSLAVLLAALAQRQKGRRLVRLERALARLDPQQHASEDSEGHREASHRALRATCELLSIEPNELNIPSGWGGTLQDVETLLRLAGDCLRWERRGIQSPGPSSVLCSIGPALLAAGRRIEPEAIARKQVLRFDELGGDLHWSILEGDLMRLLDRVMSLALNASMAGSALSFSIREGAKTARLVACVAQPSPGALELERALDPRSPDGSEKARGLRSQAQRPREIGFTGLEAIVARRMAHAWGAELSVSTMDEGWTLELLWPLPESAKIG